MSRSKGKFLLSIYYVPVPAHVCIHVCVCVCVCVCVRVCTYAHTHTHTLYTYTYIHTYRPEQPSTRRTSHKACTTLLTPLQPRQEDKTKTPMKHMDTQPGCPHLPPPLQHNRFLQKLFLYLRKAWLQGGGVGRRTGGSSSKGWSETWVHAPSNRREDVDESVALSQALLESARSQVLGGKEGARERAKAEAREGARERGSEGARKRGSEGARERGSEGARERGSEGARE